MKDVECLLDALKENVSSQSGLYSKCSDLREAMEYVRSLCLAESEMYGDARVGHTVSEQVPEKLQRAAEEFALAAGRSDVPNEAPYYETFESLSSSCSDLCKSCEYFDEHFVFFAEQTEKYLTARVMCLDPSAILDRAMSGAESTVMFSATMTPPEYFADVTGCSSAALLELESPYPTDNLCVAAVDTVSTKLLARRDTAENVADMIIAAVGARKGHYIVYFPSYKYMQTVFDAFRIAAPKGVSAVVQKQGMSHEARRKFLSFFESETQEDTLVGFCVLGGIFSEGIDLPDEKLIGAILVGIGLPGLSSELNILKEYYDRTREDGYNFAYLYPAMIKTAQAAGRVIRGEGDRGVVVLIDERYRDPELIKLLPPHWSGLHYTGDARSLSKYLERFWNDKTDGK